MPEEKLISEVTRRYSTEWFLTPALVLETPAMRVITVPEKGAKIVSVFDRSTGHEWLLPPKNGHFPQPVYGAVFVEQDMSGWDEMFPTIDRCRYPLRGAYFDANLPDHGEVWALPWQVDESSRSAICLSVTGRTLPYILSRELRFSDERTLRLSYEVINAGSEPLSLLWAAHPQFAADEATRIMLPAEVTQSRQRAGDQRTPGRRAATRLDSGDDTRRSTAPTRPDPSSQRAGASQTLSAAGSTGCVGRFAARRGGRMAAALVGCQRDPLSGHLGR